MGLFDIIAKALGVQRPLQIKPRGPLTLSRSATQFLDALDNASFMCLRAIPHQGLYAIKVSKCEKGPSAPSPHPRLLLTQDDASRVEGLQLDFNDEHWLMSLHLQVNSHETPNPNSRKYQTSRLLHRGTPVYFRSVKRAPVLVAKLLENAAITSVLIRENELTVERQPDQTWKAIDQQVDSILRHVLLRCAPIIEELTGEKFADELEQRIWETIRKEILPAIHRDGGDLQLLEFHDGVVKVALVGACATCPASTLTLKSGVERILVNAFPTEILRVEAI